MDLEPDPYGCKFDSLQVTTHDGKKTVGRHCGQGKGSKFSILLEIYFSNIFFLKIFCEIFLNLEDAPFPFIVKSNEAKLIFKSDKEEQKSGFALTLVQAFALMVL